MSFKNNCRPMKRCLVFMATAALAWQQRLSNSQLKLPFLNMLPCSPNLRNQRPSKAEVLVGD